MSLTQKIHQKAKELGFFKIGICKPEVIGDEEYFKNWFAKGFHGDMRWMETTIEKRLNIFKVYPEVKSIIVCAIDYYNDYYDYYDHNLRDWRISRYALGTDYHTVIKRKLKKLYGYIRNEDDSIRGKIFVDSGPILEKRWAQESGIGWIGKNTLVITPEKGSWIFLGEILINQELDYNDKFIKNCAGCNLCIENCPTGALIEPYFLDVNKCISYLNIENPGDIPVQFQENIGNRLFGCDVCQEVCPYNKRKEKTEVREFCLEKDSLNYLLEDFSNMDERTFYEVFKNTPVLRARYKGFIRNVNIVKVNNKKKP